MLIGCDFHPSWQQVSWLDTETGETGEQKLVQASGEAKQFYGQLAAPVRIGMEATGNSQWFLELVEDLGRVALDKSEGSVKGIVVLGGASSTAAAPERVEDQDSGNLTLNHFAVELVPPTIDSA